MSMLLIARILVGLALLTLGRRLYWLFVAGVGFVTGLALAPRLLPDASDLVIAVAALLLALVGALVALVAQRVLIAVVGFLAGGAIGALLVRAFASRPDDLIIAIAYATAGVLGAIITVILFDWALIALSSLAGATLIAGSLADVMALPPLVALALVLVLAALGALVQARAWPPPTVGAGPGRRA
jgi:hypothetical protein